MSQRKVIGAGPLSPLCGVVRLEVSSRCCARAPVPEHRKAKVATQMAVSFTCHELAIVGVISFVKDLLDSLVRIEIPTMM